VPKLKPDTQRARREHILDAAGACFARQGLHRTTIQDICREAELSPGALYVYFASKEALIAGLCERDRAEIAERIQMLAAAPDFFEALRAIGESYFVDEPVEKQRVAIDMGLEATRNERVAAIYRTVDTFCQEQFERLFQRLVDEGRIAPAVDVATLARVFHLIGDGLYWRRATDPTFAAKQVLPALIHMIAGLMNPVPPPEAHREPAMAAQEVAR